MKGSVVLCTVFLLTVTVVRPGSIVAPDFNLQDLSSKTGPQNPQSRVIIELLRQYCLYLFQNDIELFRRYCYQAAFNPGPIVIEKEQKEFSKLKEVGHKFKNA